MPDPTPPPDSFNVTVPASDLPPGPMLMANINLTISGITFECHFPVPEGPATTRQLLPIFRAFTEAIVHAATQAAASVSRPISCKAGCGACCRQLVPITEPEAHQLRDLIDHLPEPRRTHIRTRFAAARQTLQSANLLASLSDLKSQSDETLHALGMQYFEQHIPCPFLEEESCSIYADRPISCREYLVSNDPRHCSHPTPQVIDRIGLPGRVSLALARFDPDPASRLARWVPLILAPEWSASHPDSGPVHTGPEILRTVLKQLTGTTPPRPPLQIPRPPDPPTSISAPAAAP